MTKFVILTAERDAQLKMRSSSSQSNFQWFMQQDVLKQRVDDEHVSERTKFRLTPLWSILVY